MLGGLAGERAGPTGQTPSGQPRNGVWPRWDGHCRSKALEISDLRLLRRRAGTCVCALLRGSLISRATTATVLWLPDESTPAPRFRTRPVLRAPPHSPPSPGSARTHAASRLLPDQQELGTNPTPYASNDLMLIITSPASVLLRSQTNHLRAPRCPCEREEPESLVSLAVTGSPAHAHAQLTVQRLGEVQASGGLLTK